MRSDPGPQIDREEPPVETCGIRTDQAKRLKELERENSRFKKVVADLTLDKAILKEAASGSF